MLSHERRRRPRDPQSPVDWESIVIRRVAAHVKSLANDPVRGVKTTLADDWEEVIRRALRRRVQDLELT